MELEQRSTEGEHYEISDEFLNSLDELDIRTSILIAKQIEASSILVPTDTMSTYLIGGIIDDPYDGPTPFAVEVLRVDDDLVMFTDVKLISMDEYLDLINLNLYIKLNQDEEELSKNISPKGDR